MEVVATKKGFYLGPREPGDKFDMPLNKDGSRPKGAWFKEVKQDKKGPRSDEDLA